MADDLLADAEHRMKKAVEALQRDLQSIRTGRATPALVERLTVEYYGTPTPLLQIAAIHATDARTLTIQPWDKKALPDIEKAIQKSDIGLNPTNDGTVIRIVIPPLTEERRTDLVKRRTRSSTRRRSPCATSAATPTTTCASRRRAKRSPRTISSARPTACRS